MKIENEPLFLPKGSVRAILILTTTGFLLFSIWSEKIISEFVMSIWAGMIGWYFGAKLDEHTDKKINKKI